MPIAQKTARVFLVILCFICSQSVTKILKVKKWSLNPLENRLQIVRRLICIAFRLVGTQAQYPSKHSEC